MKYPTSSKWTTASRVVLVLAPLILSACSSKPAADGDDDARANPATSVVEITTTRVSRASVSSVLAVTGTIAALPNQDVKVSSLVSGRIASMAVAEGDRVEPGQELAKIDDRPFRDPLRQAEAAVEQAKANFDNAQLNRARMETLFQRGVAAQKDLEDARTLMSVN